MIALLAASVAPIAFMSDTCETVFVKVKGQSDPVRVNKDDFDADQAEGGEGKYTLDKTDPMPSDASTVSTLPDNAIIPPAPSAPAFADGGKMASGADLPNGGAAAPANPSVETKVVLKEGTGAKTKYYAANSKGEKLTGIDGIDEAGYPDEASAWEAIMKLPQTQGGENPNKPQPADALAQPEG